MPFIQCTVAFVTSNAGMFLSFFREFVVKYKLYYALCQRNRKLRSFLSLSPLPLYITPSFFYSTLKTYIFHKSFYHRLLTLTTGLSLRLSNGVSDSFRYPAFSPRQT